MEKAPKVTSTSLSAFFRLKNVEMQGSSSQVAAEVGAEVNQGSPMKKISYKRKKVERKEKETEAAEDILGEKSVDLEQVRRFTDNQRALHGYRGSEKLTSVWGEHFPYSAIADEHAQNPSDVKIVHDVGDVGVAQFLCWEYV
nr:uncharacterized protein LOC114927453 [Arachis hypogaea]